MTVQQTTSIQMDFKVFRHQFSHEYSLCFGNARENQVDNFFKVNTAVACNYKESRTRLTVSIVYKFNNLGVQNLSKRTHELKTNFSRDVHVHVSRKYCFVKIRLSLRLKQEGCSVYHGPHYNVHLLVKPDAYQTDNGPPNVRGHAGTCARVFSPRFIRTTVLVPPVVNCSLSTGTGRTEQVARLPR